MNLVHLLGQVLPLLVFIIADSVFNNIRISIISAIVFAIGQLIFYYMKTGCFDWFVLLDVGLIAGLGVISILLKNDVFFKVKPAIVEGMMIVFFVVLIFLPDQFLNDYLSRMMPEGMALNHAAIGKIKTMLLWMGGYLLLHIGAILYTAIYSSRKLWAFISGPGFFVLFIPVLLIIFIIKLHKKHIQNKSVGN